MRYEVYITRAEHHSKGAQTPIPQRDWQSLIATDPELAAPDEAAPDFARWRGRSSVDRPWIEWADGNLFTIDPDYSVIRKLVEIAGLLGGHVQGRDGERYSVERSRVVREDPASAGSGSSAPPPVGAGSPGGPVRNSALNPSLSEAELAAELDAVLGALESSGGRMGTLTAPEPARPDPNAGFARPPEDVLHAEPGKGAGVDVPFDVGQRVRTPWGRPATIVKIDRTADEGLGTIEIKYDDGRIAMTSCVAHGLEPE